MTDATPSPPRNEANTTGEAPVKDGPVYGRYTITHKDGQPIDPTKRYFVLSPDSDPYAKAALVAYADACQMTHPDLAQSIYETYDLTPAADAPDRCRNSSFTNE